MRHIILVFALCFVLPNSGIAQTASNASTSGIAQSLEPSGDAPNVKITVSAVDFRACDTKNLVSRWRTSSHYLRETVRCIYEKNPDNPREAKRTALIEDIFIKSWSYAILNKAFFWLSVALAVLVLTWPSLVAIFKKSEAEVAAAQAVSRMNPDGSIAVGETSEVAEKRRSFLVRAVNAASMQTTITALAALCFAFYSHYKERQVVAENLMRSVLYMQDFSQPNIDVLVKEISAMDKGFGFSAALGQPSNTSADQSSDFP